MKIDDEKILLACKLVFTVQLRRYLYIAYTYIKASMHTCKKNSLINKNNSFIHKVACLAICMSGSLASIPSKGEDSGGNGGKDPQKFKVEGMELPISPK